MTSLQEIPGLDPELVPLLQSSGIESPADLAVVPAKVVHQTLEKGLGKGRAVPSLHEVEVWQRLVRGEMIPGGEGSTGFPAGDQLPVAMPLSGRQLMESGIPASAVPVARILGEPTAANLLAGPPRKLEQASEAVPLKVVRRAGNSRPQATWGAEKPAVEKALVPVHKVEPSIIRVEQEEELPEPMKFASTDQRIQEQQDVARKNRGMIHKDPWRVWWGGVATLLANLLTLIGAGTIVAVLVMEFMFKKPVPPQLPWCLLAFPVALLVFLMGATRPRCRLCGQRLFVPRQCGRHVRAHRSIFGYATSMALHVVAFRWFRCSLCGTKQRLKQ